MSAGVKEKNKVIGVIPARYASVRLPGKPLIDLNGKSMIQRTYEQALKSKLIERVIVATDDERIFKAVDVFGGNAVMTSVNIKSGSDRVAEVAEKVDGDIFVNIQGDEPLIDPEMIDEAIGALIADKESMVSTLAQRLSSQSDLNNSNIVKVVFDEKERALYFSRSPIPFLRDASDNGNWVSKFPFYKHVGLYVYRKDFLKIYSKLSEAPLEKAEKLEQLRVLYHGYKIHVAVTEYDSISVDTSEDVEKVKALLKS